MGKSAVRRMWVMVVIVLGMLALAAPAAWANTFTVSNTNDSGAGSLRQAIIDANNTPGEDTIAFGPQVGDTYPAETVALKSPLPQLSSVRIEGPGAHRLTVQIFRDAETPPSFIGHIFNVGAGATVSIDGLTMTLGGGVKLDGSSGAINGGAVFNPATGTLKITNSTVSESQAQRGSGIFNAGTLTIADSTICDNGTKLSGGAGAGLFNAGSGTLTVVDSTFCNNGSAGVSTLYPTTGGGIFNEGTLTVEGSTFSGNIADRGGAIFNAGGASLTMTNATISGNGAPVDGAAIYNEGEADIKSNTITENSRRTITNSGRLALGNSIVAGNEGCRVINGPFTDLGFNLICGDPRLIDDHWRVDYDPMLGPLQDNGGPTKTHLPAFFGNPDAWNPTKSPAIDNGSIIGPTSTDQRGVQRPQDDPLSANATSGDGTDIGAVEVKVPKASIGDVSLTEGNGATTDASFTVRLSESEMLSESEVSARNVTVNYSTQDDEATSPADYSSASGTLEFTSRGEAVSKTISVPVQGDAMDEPTEGFSVNLSSWQPEYVADGSAIGTIHDDDAPPALSISDATATEATSGTASAAFTVSLSTPSGKAVSVDYSTSDGTASAASGDYPETSGTLYLRPGTTSKSVSVPVNSDTNSEPDETFFLNLSGPENATVADDKGEGTIVDSTPVNGAPTANNDSYSTNQDKPLRVAAPGLLSNDSDPEGGALTAVEATDPAHGEVFVRADGSFAYFPEEGYLGADSFTYKALDGSNSSESATVEITVRDVTAPTVTGTSPASGATGVAPGANVAATFSEAMKTSSINLNTVKLYASGSTTPITAIVTYDAATKKAVLNPSANLKRGATYRAVVTTGAKDLAGNALDQNPSVTGNQQKVWFFTISP
jgi:Big-like domain-containing protein/Calx-beta domain-containing protein